MSKLSSVATWLPLAAISATACSDATTNLLTPPDNLAETSAISVDATQIQKIQLSERLQINAELADALQIQDAINPNVTGPSACNISITSPADNTVFNSNSTDSDGVRAGFQADVTVSSDNCPDADVVLTVGAAAYLGSLSGNTGTVGVDVEEGTSTISAFIVNGDTAGAPDTVNVIRDSIGPSIGVIAPADGDTLDNTDDADADNNNGINVAISGTTDGVSGTYSLTCSDNDGLTADETDSGALSIAAGNFTATTSGVTQPNCTLSFSIDDENGNTGTDSVNFTVNFETPVGPTIAINQPTENDVLNLADDAAGDNGFQAAFSLTTAEMNDGTTVTLTDSTRGVLGTCTVASNACSTNLTLADGTYAVTASGNSRFNISGNSSVRNFAVDATPPSVATIVAAKDSNNNGTINRTENGGVATGGNLTSNVTVTFNAGTLENGRTVTLNSSRTGNFTATVNNNVATFTNVTFPPGTTNLTVTATDLAGNPTQVAGSTRTYIIDTQPPALSITAPTALLLTSANDINSDVAGLQINFTFSTAAENGQQVELRDNGRSLGFATVTNGAATLSNISLTEGTRNLRAFVKDVAGNATNTAAYQPVVDTVGPSLAFTAPTDNTIIDLNANPAADLDNGVNGLQIDAVISNTQVNVGGSITVVSNLDGVVGTATADANPKTIRLTLQSGGLHTLNAFANDANGNQGVSAGVDVAVTLAGASEDVTELSGPFGVSGWGQSLARKSGDINGDGIEDTVVGAPNKNGNTRGGFEVFLGGSSIFNITRTFVTPPATLTCSQPTCTTREMGWAVNIIESINGDAFDDVVVVGYDTERFDAELIAIYAGSASGIAANATPVAVLEADFFSFAGYVSQTVGDIDGDGDQDWAINSPISSEVFVFLNTGAFPSSGLLRARASSIVTLGTPDFAFGQAIAGVGDTDADGRAEFAVVDPASKEVYVIRGRAVWPASLDASTADAADIFIPSTSVGTTTFGQDLSAGDVDGDGDLDLVILADNGLHIVPLSGTTFSATSTRYIPTEGFVLDFGAGLAAADTAGDGFDDLLIAGNTAVQASVAPVTLGADLAPAITIPVDGADGLFVSSGRLNTSKANRQILAVTSASPGKLIFIDAP